MEYMDKQHKVIMSGFHLPGNLALRFEKARGEARTSFAKAYREAIALWCDKVEQEAGSTAETQKEDVC